MFGAIPLMLLTVLLYNLIAFLGPSLFPAPPVPEGMPVPTSSELVQAVLYLSFTVDLPSGAAWTCSLADLLLAVGLGALLRDVIFATRLNHRSALYALTGFAVVLVTAAQFLLLPGFGTATYFLIMLMAVVSFIAGLTVTPIRAWRNLVRRPAPDPIETASAEG